MAEHSEQAMSAAKKYLKYLNGYLKLHIDMYDENIIEILQNKGAAIIDEKYAELREAILTTLNDVKNLIDFLQQQPQVDKTETGKKEDSLIRLVSGQIHNPIFGYNRVKGGE